MTDTPADQIADYERVPMHPFTEEEVEQIAAFASIDPAKVTGVAWLTTLKMREQQREAGDRMMRQLATWQTKEAT